ncbi:histamine H2 receptor-like [Oculina patagonica]
MAVTHRLCPSSLSIQSVTPAIYALGVACCAFNIPVVVFSVLGNSLVIYVIWRHHSLHNNHNYLLVAIAATDVITGLVTQPLSVTAIFQEVQQDINCGIKDAQAACNLLCNMTSLLTLMLLSSERILSVCFPFWHDTLVTPRRLLVLVVGIWLSSLLLVLTPYYHVLKPQTRMRVGMMFQSAAFIIIVIISLFMYRIARRHENQIAAQVQVANQVEGQQSLQLTERKSFKATVFVLGALILCQIPLFITGFLYRIKVLDEHAFALALWPVTALMHLNSVLNFCIYSWRNSGIRVKIMQLINMGQNNNEPAQPPPTPTTGNYGVPTATTNC